MKKAAVLLAAVAVAALVAVYVLRPSPPVEAPPRVAPPAPSGTPVVQPRTFETRPAQDPGDPLLQRWRLGILNHSQKDVLDAQAAFLSREGDYREKLKAMATGDADPRVRAFSVAVLGRMASPPAEEFFVERMGDAHEFPRTSALEALEKKGTTACLAAVDRLAAQDPVETVRAAAAKAAKAVRSR